MALGITPGFAFIIIYLFARTVNPTNNYWQNDRLIADDQIYTQGQDVKNGMRYKILNTNTVANLLNTNQNYYIAAYKHFTQGAGRNKCDSLLPFQKWHSLSQSDEFGYD